MKRWAWSSCLVFLVAGALCAQQSYEDLRLVFERDNRPLATFEKLAKAQPDNPWVWHFLGLAAEECGLRKRAETALGRALTLDNRQAWHWQAMATHWEGRRLWDQAELCLERALELEKRPAPARALEQRLKQVIAQGERHTQQQEDLQGLPYRMAVVILGGLAILAALATALKLLPANPPHTSS